jgi:hypothetical protein
MFVAAFFCNAIIVHHDPADWGPKSDVVSGWLCALSGLIYTLGIPTDILALVTHFGSKSEHMMLHGVAYSVSALANWLVPLSLFVPRRFRSAVAMALGLSLITTVGLILARQFQPLVGCYLWMAGALLSLAPEIARWFRPEVEVEEPAEP